MQRTKNGQELGEEQEQVKRKKVLVTQLCLTLQPHEL